MSTRHHEGLVVLLYLVAAFNPVGLSAQVPDSLSFQGVLTDSNGVTVPDGDYDLLFKMYKGSTKVWEQTHSSTPVKSGLFNVILSGGSTWPLDTVAFNKPIDLGIALDGGSELAPRTPLTAATYALGMRGLHAVEASISDLESLNLIGGADNNSVGSNVVGATIGGGGGWTPDSYPNTVVGHWGTVSGGRGNTAGWVAAVGGGINNNASHNSSTIAGGQGNTATESYAAVGGGISNNAVGNSSTVSGGVSNLASGDYSSISGGSSNQANGTHSTVGGGALNKADTTYSVVGGGRNNFATGTYSTVPGGEINDATGTYSVVGGGKSNQATGAYSTIPGGKSNEASAAYTFAAGLKAESIHTGSFVWADSASASGTKFATTAVNQFLIRAGGGVGIGTNSPDAQLDIAGGNNWNLAATDGDLKIGNDTYKLEVGVSLGGGGAGTSRLNAVGGIGRLTLGGSEVDVVSIDAATGVFPFSTNTYSLGKSGSVWTAVWATDGTINTSDVRLKSDISNSPFGLKTVLDLRPVVFRWKEGKQGRKVGLIAQEVESVIPEVVVPPKTEDEFYGLNYSELVPVLIRAIQEQQAVIAQLEADHADVLARLASLERSVTN